MKDKECKIVAIRPHPHYEDVIIVTIATEAKHIASPDQEAGVLVQFPNCIDRLLVVGDDVYTLGPTGLNSDEGASFAGDNEEFLAVRKKIPDELAQKVIDLVREK